MRWSLVALSLLLFLSSACRDRDSRIGWKDVETAKTNYEANADSLAAHQEYIDSLAAYLQQHPGDDKASQLYIVEEIAYARSMIEKGRFAAAIPYYEDAIIRSPQDEALRTELEEMRGKVTVSRDRFEQLSKGMSREEVRDLIGSPRPGWIHRIEKAGRSYETWYFKRTDGGLASISFVDDTILLAEYGEIVPLS